MAFDVGFKPRFVIYYLELGVSICWCGRRWIREIVVQDYYTPTEYLIRVRIFIGREREKR